MRIAVGGIDAYAATGGRPFDPTLPVVVFVHGSASDHTVWSQQTRYFSHHGRSVLAVDLPGHGRTDAAPLTTIGEIADWLMALMSAAGVDSATFVGHSMGSLAALDAAARYGNRVHALALLGTSDAMRVGDALLDAARNDEPAAIDMITSWGHSPSGHLGGIGPIGMWLLGGADWLMARSRPGVIYTDLWACHTYDDAPTAAKQVACQTLVIAGEDDRMTPAAAGERLAGFIDNVEVVRLKGAGHMMMYEQPVEVLEALKRLA